MNKFHFAAALVAFSLFQPAPARAQYWGNGNETNRYIEHHDQAYIDASRGSRWDGDSYYYYDPLPIFPLFCIFGGCKQNRHEQGERATIKHPENEWEFVNGRWERLVQPAPSDGQRYTPSAPPTVYSGSTTQSYIEGGYYVTIVTKPDGSVITTKTPVRR